MLGHIFPFLFLEQKFIAVFTRFYLSKVDEQANSEDIDFISDDEHDAT